MLVIIMLPIVALKNTRTNYATYLQNTDYESYIEITGTVECAETTPVVLSYPVYIKSCHIKEDTYVNKGQLLFTLDIEKTKNYVKELSFTSLNSLGISLEKEDFSGISEQIYASESGYIKELSVESNTFALPDEALCIISPSDEVLLKITLTQDDYSKVSISDKVEFSPLIASSKVFESEICNKTAKIRKEASLSGSKTVVDIYAYADRDNPYMIHGLQFKGKIITEPVKKINTLPYNYINQDENGEYVVTYKKGNTEKVYIETGIETNSSVEIITEFADKTMFLRNDYYKGKSILKYEE